MTEEEIKEDLAILLKETTSVLGGTDQTYTGLLHLLNNAGKLLMPKRIMKGQLVFFKYKPQSEPYVKWNSNKYYDKYPLVLITETYREGFAGLNLHFLDPKHRKLLYELIMDGLPKIRSGQDWLSRLMVDYERLEGRKRLFKFYKPCYRRYNWSGIKRRPVVIPYEIWEDMVDSHTMRIERARPITVFRDSYKSAIRNVN